MLPILLAGVMAIGGQEAPVADWKISTGNSFEFGGKPYIPVGLHIQPTVEAIDEAKKSGIEDVYLELPLDLGVWRRILPELESRQMRYLIGLSALAPAAKVFAVEPQSYRLSGLTGEVKKTIEIPGATKAYGLLANESHGAIAWQGMLAMDGGKLNLEHRVRSEFPHVLVLYPEVKDHRMVDYWEGFDEYRDNLLLILKNAPLGTGYRGLVNPLGRMIRSFETDDAAIPTSAMFRLEFETFLRQKYGTTNMVASAWSLGASDAESFNDFASIVPLWQGGRGIEFALNLKNGRTIATHKNTPLWEDLRTVIRSSASRRYNRLVEAAKLTTGRPVIQEWGGWGGLYEESLGPLDGISFRLNVNSPAKVIGASAKPMSSALRRPRRMPGLATSVRIAPNEVLTHSLLLRQTESIGTRGWFFLATNEAERQLVAELAAEHRDSESMSQATINPLFFPEAATNPALAGRLPGGYVWLPSAGAGERMDIGPLMEGYRSVEGGVTTYVFWAIKEPVRLKMKLATDAVPTLLSLDGSDLAIKQKRSDLEMTVPTSPVIMTGSADVPTPVQTFEATALACAYLIDTFGNLVDFTGTEYVRMQETNAAFPRAPLASYLSLREQFRTLAVRAAPYTWIEGERSEQSNFSDIVAVPGSSGGSVLSLKPKIKNQVPYTAMFTIKNKTGGRHKIWIAARMDDAALDAIEVTLAGQKIKIDREPVSFYGPGFAWYSLGDMELPAGQTTMWIRYESGTIVQCDLDAVLVEPGAHEPSGPYPPTDWVWAAVNAAKPPR